MERAIHREMTIEEIFSLYPVKSQKLADTLSRFGLQCAGCQAATYETLEAGWLGHGFDEEDLDDLIVELNRVIEEPLDQTTISLTPRAAEKFQAICQEEGLSRAALRFGDQPGGCSGFEYVFGFSEALGEGDHCFESHGVEIHVKKEALSRLLGCEIDYAEGLMGSGFKVSNPNVSSSCSCGHSQNY